MSKSSSECPILEAPNEILYIISGFLDSGCILRLRQTCKRLSGTRISTVSIPETTLVKQVIRKLPRTEIQHLSVSETLLPCVVSLRTRVQSLDLTATNNEYYRSCGKLENLFFCRLTGFDMDSLDFLKNPIRKLHLYNCQGTFYKTIGLLRQLRVLELHFCRSLKELEHVDSDMEVLELVWCHQLKNITHINALSHLRQLVLCRLPIDALPDLTNTRLERLQLWRCSSLSNANQLSYLKHLRVLELHTVPLTELPDLDQLPLERLQLHQLNRLHDVSCLGGMHLDFLRISFCDFLSDLTVLETMTVKQLELVRLSRLSRMSWSIGTQVLVFDIEHSIEIPSSLMSLETATINCHQLDLLSSCVAINNLTICDPWVESRTLCATSHWPLRTLTLSSPVRGKSCEETLMHFTEHRYLEHLVLDQTTIDSIPDLSKCPRLETITLIGCYGLVDTSSLVLLETLKTLNVVYMQHLPLPPLPKTRIHRVRTRSRPGV